MRGLLADLQDAGEAPPDLVVADHGWAGAAGQAGVTAVGFADCNDPALFVGEAEGTGGRLGPARRQRAAAPLRADDGLPARGGRARTLTSARPRRRTPDVR